MKWAMYNSPSVGRRPIMPVSLKLLDWVSAAAIDEAAAGSSRNFRIARRVAESLTE
jgi:hypothetical protein